MEAINWTKRTRSTLVRNIMLFQPGWEVTPHQPNGCQPRPYIKVEAGPYRYDVIIAKNGDLVLCPRDQPWLAPQPFSFNNSCGPIARRIGKAINIMMRSRVCSGRRFAKAKKPPLCATTVGQVTRVAFEGALSQVMDRSMVKAEAWSEAAADVERFARKVTAQLIAG